MKKPTNEVRYFIVGRSHLSEYGNENGSDKSEAERLLAESGDSITDLIVIRGEMIKPTFKLDAE